MYNNNNNNTISAVGGLLYICIYIISFKSIGVSLDPQSDQQQQQQQQQMNQRKEIEDLISEILTNPAPFHPSRSLSSPLTITLEP